jgi:hypothetical protein
MKKLLILVCLPFLSLFLFFSSSGVAYAGPICTGFVDCLPITTALILYTYGISILGGVIILCGVFQLFAGSKNKLVASICFLIGLFLIVLNWYLIYQGQHRYTKEQRVLAQTASFDLFMPTYIPHGYGLTSLSFANPRDANNPYLSMRFRNNLSYSFQIEEFDKTKTAHVEGNCGPLSPEAEGLFTNNCVLIGTTPSGITIYESGLPNQNMVDIDGKPTLLPDYGNVSYVTINHTRISLDNPPLPREEILKILSSFQQTSADKLDFVCCRD